MSEHALLNPSGAEIWSECTPAGRLQKLFDDTAGTAAQEGTLAHAIGELLLKFRLDRIIKKEYDKLLAAFKNHPLFEPSMFDYCEDYAGFVMEQYAEALAHTPNAQIFIEKRLDLTRWVPEGFGTGDAIITANRWMIFVDLKYGKGVRVSAQKNKQLRLYGLGAVDEYEASFDFENIRMIIFQPRLDNISIEEMPLLDLLNWGDTFIKPRAKMAWEGTGPYVPGDHCRFCRAKITCKANAEYQLELAKYEFLKADLLDDFAIADVLERYDMFVNWIQAVEEFALAEAVKGRKWPGFKLVAGRSNRAYKSEVDVVNKLVSLGHAASDLYNSKIKGLGDMEKQIGKTAFNKHVDPLLHKPPGKPALAPESDPRPVYNNTAAAIEDFKDI